MGALIRKRRRQQEKTTSLGSRRAKRMVASGKRRWIRGNFRLFRG